VTNAVKWLTIRMLATPKHALRGKRM